MKHKHGWASVVCCFVLFIVVCLSLTMHVQGAFRAAGHPEIGLLFFTLPGAVASFCSHRREVIRPLIGAMLAAPFCLVLMRGLPDRFGKNSRGYLAPYSGVR